MARVFADGSPSTSIVNINRAVEWCADQPGTRVINLSLGSPSIDTTSERIYETLAEENNILVFAAAGNGGNTQYSYPASYDHVISVAAIDENFNLAGFSQENDQVDISGPGVGILSMSAGGLAIIFNGQVLVEGINDRVHQFAKFVELDDDDLIEEDLEVIDCGVGDDECDNVEDKVCLIERGNREDPEEPIFFWEKAKACEDGDGIMVLIYNNVDGIYSGSITEEEADDIDIPVLALTREEGLALLNSTIVNDNGEEDDDGDSTPTEIRIEDRPWGYARQSGTSMASPHVAGVAAKIWAARPQCTAKQVEEALLQTAMQLGQDNDDVMIEDEDTDKPEDGNDDDEGPEDGDGDGDDADPPTPAPTPKPTNTQQTGASEDDDEDRRNDQFGYGLVQGVDAYNYLLTLEEPCGDVPSSAPSEVPSEAPSSAPTLRPSSMNDVTFDRQPTLAPRIRFGRPGGQRQRRRTRTRRNLNEHNNTELQKRKRLNTAPAETPEVF